MKDESGIFSVLIFLFLIFSPTFFSCSKAGNQDVFSDLKKFRIISEIKRNKNSPFYIDFKNFPDIRNNLPIGVFDSGTGGLTVLDAVMGMDEFNNGTYEKGSDGIPDFISESFIYLADKANMPYGRYDSEGKSDFLKELVLKNVQFLLGNSYYASPEDSLPRTDKLPVKAIVIACNTGTAYGVDLIRKALKEWGLEIKVIGVIDAGARSAVSNPRINEENRVIGVFATEGTCSSGGYPTAIQKYFRDLYGTSIDVVQQAGFGWAGAIDGDSSYIDPKAVSVRGKDFYQGPNLGHRNYPIDPAFMDQYNFEKGPNLLVNVDEEGTITEIELNSVRNYVRYYVTRMVANVSSLYPGKILDSVVLGCTHYPFYEKEIKDHFLYLRNFDGTFEKVIPEDISLIDPSLSEAIELYGYLKEQNLFADSKNEDSEFYISVPNPLLKQNQLDENGEFPLAYKYGREINQFVLFVKRVPFSELWLTKDVRERIKARMPGIYDIMFNKQRSLSGASDF